MFDFTWGGRERERERKRDRGFSTIYEVSLPSLLIYYGAHCARSDERMEAELLSSYGLRPSFLGLTVDAYVRILRGNSEEW